MNLRRLIFLMLAAGTVAGCATEPPPLPFNNAAEPQVRGSSRTPRNVLAQDETTLAIERALKATQAQAENAASMNEAMPGMKHDKKEEGHEEH